MAEVRRDCERSLGQRFTKLEFDLSNSLSIVELKSPPTMWGVWGCDNKRVEISVKKPWSGE